MLRERRSVELGLPSHMVGTIMYRISLNSGVVLKPCDTERSVELTAEENITEVLEAALLFAVKLSFERIPVYGLHRAIVAENQGETA